MPDTPDVPAAVRELARRLSRPSPMRRGTLAVRYLRCNKPGCPCAVRADARHGPYTSVVRVVAGRTRSRHVPPDRVAELRRQVEAGRQFRKDVEAFWQACEQWADVQLDALEATSQEAAKKGGSKRPSTPKSSGKSKR
ncbi:MAG: hypothetical protein HW381_692 [Candidatus Rokubacteria bacterium]|nr:hypothetical protein [Candidatus Rokubacteria bacterium]